MGPTGNVAEAASSDEITLVVDGAGSNKMEATENALRSAIEQAYGTFVSVNTEILNDALVKDEIITVASGNIKSYKELSSFVLPNGNTSVSLSAVVSIGKLVSFAKSKGASAEFAGQTFMMNMKMRELNKKNERIALDHCLTLIEQIPDLFDYSISIDTPIEVSGGYLFPLSFVVQTNDNYDAAIELLMKTLSSLSLSNSEVNDYQKSNSKYKEVLVYKGYKIVRSSTSPGYSPRNPGSRTVTTRVYGPDYEAFYLRNTDYILEDCVMRTLVNKLLSYTINIEYINKEPRKMGLQDKSIIKVARDRARGSYNKQPDVDVPPYYLRDYYTNNEHIERIPEEKIKKLQLMTWYNRGNRLSEFNQYGEISPGTPRTTSYPYSILHKGKLYSFSYPIFIGYDEAANIKGISIQPCQYQPKTNTTTPDFWDMF